VPAKTFVLVALPLAEHADLHQVRDHLLPE
jgi:hypothetical protein